VLFGCLDCYVCCLLCFCLCLDVLVCLCLDFALRIVLGLVIVWWRLWCFNIIVACFTYCLLGVLLMCISCWFACIGLLDLLMLVVDLVVLDVVYCVCCFACLGCAVCFAVFAVLSGYFVITCDCCVNSVASFKDSGFIDLF